MIKTRKIKNTVLSVSVCLALGFGGISSIVQAQEDPEKLEISMSSILVFALNNNPDIEILEERAIQSEEFMKQKKAEYLPTVSLAVDGGREYNNPASGGTSGASDINNTGGISLAVDQLIFDGFSTLNQVREREQTVTSNNYRTQAQVEDTINDAVDNYLQIIQYQNVLAIHERFIQQIASHVNTIQNLFEAGATPKVMLDYAQSRLAFAQTALNRASSSLNDALSNLELLTGKLPPGFVAIPPESLNPDKLDLQYYINIIEKNNSEVLANESDIIAAEHRLRAEKGKEYPSVNFSLTADQSHNEGGPIGTDREVAATIQVTYDIFDGFKKKYAQNLIKSQVRELNITREQTLKDLRRNVKLAYNQFIANENALETTELEIRSNEAQKKLNEENFRLGTINAIELIESAERLRESLVKKEEIIYDSYLNAYNLLVLTGILDDNYFCASCKDITADLGNRETYWSSSMPEDDFDYLDED